MFGKGGSDEPAPLPSADSLESKIIVLNDTDFEKRLGKELDQLFVVFYAPWCPHWQQFEPELILLDKSLQHHKMKNRVAIIDASINTRMVEEYHIKAYPTIKWFSRGKYHDYRGPKSVSGMLNWIAHRINTETGIRSTRLKLCLDISKNI